MVANPGCLTEYGDSTADCLWRNPVELFHAARFFGFHVLAIFRDVDISPESHQSA